MYVTHDDLEFLVVRFHVVFILSPKLFGDKTI